MDRWLGIALNKLAAHQVFFNGLCEVVQHAKPSGQFGRADVFKKGAWIWEFKDRNTCKLEGDVRATADVPRFIRELCWH